MSFFEFVISVILDLIEWKFGFIEKWDKKSKKNFKKWWDKFNQ